MSFRKEFKEFLERNKISQNKAAEAAGYTGSVISQWLAGNYKGDMEAVEKTLRTWMIRESSRRTRKNVPIVDIANLKRITNAVSIAHEERDIALITGPAGVGKTTALRRYVDQNPHGSLLIEVDESMSKPAIIKELAERLGLDRKTPHTELVRLVAHTLSERDLVVIIDEADYLSDGSLELMRRVVNDKGRSALVLVGLQRLVFRIKNLKNDHQQLASRVGVLVEVEPLTQVDGEAIIKEAWPKLEKDVIKALLKKAGGSVRSLTKLIDRSHRTAIANGLQTPDAETVYTAGALILR